LGLLPLLVTAVSLAPAGALFLDKFAEYQRQALDAVRESLEEGAITISSAGGAATYARDSCSFPRDAPKLPGPPDGFTLLSRLNVGSVDARRVEGGPIRRAPTSGREELI
jgi:hypothetical protein